MEMTSNTVLITGGASGIGFALAERFVKAGNKVIICGRRKEALKKASSLHPEITTYECNLALASERTALADRIKKEFPGLNILVNNAGIQRRMQLMEQDSWDSIQEEIAINLEAPIHLTSLLLPHLLTANKPAVINVTSGLSFTPLVNVPVYCATKAALHSYTLSLRHQLSGSKVRVVELIPPAVDTDLGGPGLHTFGAPLNVFADAAFEGLAKGDIEITYGFSEKSSRASRQELDQMFSQMNKPN